MPMTQTALEARLAAAFPSSEITVTDLGDCMPGQCTRGKRS